MLSLYGIGAKLIILFVIQRFCGDHAVMFSQATCNLNVLYMPVV